MLFNDHNGVWRTAGRSGSSCPGTTPGLESIVDALPQAKRCELQGRHHWDTYPDQRRKPPSLHTRTFIRLRGGPDTIRGPISHSVREPKRRHWLRPEAMQLVVHCYTA